MGWSFWEKPWGRIKTAYWKDSNNGKAEGIPP